MTTMKILEQLQKAFTAFFLIVIALSILTWLGVINPFDRFESRTSSAVEDKLRVAALEGDADAQNKLGTLLYKKAEKYNTDFSEAIDWFNEAGRQHHPIAQVNLGFAYKAGNGVIQNNDEAIKHFYQSGLNFLRIGFPMDAKDNVYSINKINSKHPLKFDLIAAIKKYEKDINP